MMKRFVKGTVLVLAWSLFWGLAQAEFKVGAEQGVLWKIEKRGSEPSFIMGTVHVGDERVLSLPEPVERHLKAASSFTGEIVFNTANILYASAAQALPAGQELKRQVDKDTYKKAVAAMAERGVPEEVVNRMKPWAIAVTLSVPVPESGMVLDTLLYSIAQQQGKPLYGLESAKEQIAIFDTLSQADQRLYLRDTLEQLPVIPQVHEELLKAYLDRDLAALKAISDQIPQGSEAAANLSRRLMAAAIDERNHRFVERMGERLDEGGAFFAVGALHLPGEQGVLHLLERKGYAVSPVY